MAGRIIACVVYFGCAILFYGIGIYAQRLKKPMWFWAGTSVDPKQITDVKQYNKENGVMWKLYSLWYVAAGIAELWNSVVSVVILFMSCSVGLFLLVGEYNRIYKKYRVKESS